MATQTGDKRKLYDVDVNGVKHTLKLSDEDAESYKEQFGDKIQPKSKARRPANKAAAAPQNKAADGDGGAPADSAK